ncbi:MAG: glycosyltransferase family 4 protein [Bacteroidia bacterium]|nr:glycosyltransferase family 4 protein [Bacteroidia bacterium]MDW8056903.1 glycosyltransferase family 4 protein [Bacteroidia bacterium]
MAKASSSYPILLLTVYPPARIGGTRYRIEQYIPLLRKEGFEIEWVSFFSLEEYEAFLRPSESLLKKVGLFVKNLGRSILQALFRRQWRGIYLYREATLLGTPLIEHLWMRGLPVLLDFDDAIWIVDTSPQFRRFAWLKSPKKLSKLLRKSAVVTVCNEFLASYARKYAQDVRIIPTTVDTDLYHPVGKPGHIKPVVIGWSGSSTTLAHLRTVEAALKQLHEKYKDEVHFLFVGAPEYKPPFPAEVLPWSAATEIALLQRMDIGIMPLPDTVWSRGKCALKALLYMSVGVPPVVSPIGMNCEVVRDGIDGLWAGSISDWVEKLSFLIEHPQERKRLGAAARQKVVEKYSTYANAEKYIQAFRAAFGDPRG